MPRLASWLDDRSSTCSDTKPCRSEHRHCKMVNALDKNTLQRSLLLPGDMLVNSSSRQLACMGARLVSEQSSRCSSRRQGSQGQPRPTSASGLLPSHNSRRKGRCMVGGRLVRALREATRTCSSGAASARPSRLARALPPAWKCSRLGSSPIQLEMSVSRLPETRRHVRWAPQAARSAAARAAEERWLAERSMLRSAVKPAQAQQSAHSSALDQAEQVFPYASMDSTHSSLACQAGEVLQPVV